MLLTTFYSSPPQQQYYSAYTPPRSSPLSERSANVAPRIFDSSMTSPCSDKKPSMPQRAYKPNPVIQTRGAATKRRRDLFFRRVQNGREDKKWESRGEQIQQLDFVSERKRWEAEKARQAPPEEDDMIEDVDGEASLPLWTSSLPQDEPEMAEADYVAAQEEYELQQLIAAMEQDDQENDASSQHFGSDDEDYDSLFMECATTVAQHRQQEPQTPHLVFNTDGMDMDMTDG